MTRLVGVRAVCDGCSSAAANIFCITHRNVLCQTCDTLQHPAANSHVRVCLSSAVTALPFCEFCDDAPATVFCESEQSTLCDKCDRAVHKKHAMQRTAHWRTPIESTLVRCDVEFRMRRARPRCGRAHVVTFDRSPKTTHNTPQPHHSPSQQQQQQQQQPPSPQPTPPTTAKAPTSSALPPPTPPKQRRRPRSSKRKSRPSSKPAIPTPSSSTTTPLHTPPLAPQIIQPHRSKPQLSPPPPPDQPQSYFFDSQTSVTPFITSDTPFPNLFDTPSIDLQIPSYDDLYLSSNPFSPPPPPHPSPRLPNTIPLAHPQVTMTAVAAAAAAAAGERFLLSSHHLRHVPQDMSIPDPAGLAAAAIAAAEAAHVDAGGGKVQSLPTDAPLDQSRRRLQATSLQPALPSANDLASVAAAQQAVHDEALRKLVASQEEGQREAAGGAALGAKDENALVSMYDERDVKMLSRDCISDVELGNSFGVFDDIEINLGGGFDGGFQASLDDTGEL